MAPSKATPAAMAKVAAATADPAPEASTVDVEPAAERPFMSAGVASDLAMQGWAGDPTTGGIFRRDAETGEVTFTPRT